jgi:hypothetical protein
LKRAASAARASSVRGGAPGAQQDAGIFANVFIDIHQYNT